MGTENQGTPLSVTCSLCGSGIYTQENLWKDTNGNFHCNECMMETNCASCGTQLVLSKRQVAQINGDPICVDCNSLGNSSQRTSSSGKLELASLWRRAIGAIVDIVGFFSVLILLTELFDIMGLFGYSNENPGIWIYVIFIIGYFFYFISAEDDWGKTLGKQLTGTKVVKTNGAELSIADATIRNIVRPIDLVFGYGLGAAGIMLSSKSQRLGDDLAGTMVIRDR